MKVSEIESTGLTSRILKTLGAYFKIDVSAADPLLEELEVRNQAGYEHATTELGNWLEKNRKN
jgi:hypothetical protein